MSDQPDNVTPPAPQSGQWSSGPQPRRVEFPDDRELLILLPGKSDPVIQSASLIEITEGGQLWLVARAPDGTGRLVAIYAAGAWSSIRPLSGQ